MALTASGLMKIIHLTFNTSRTLIFKQLLIPRPPDTVNFIELHTSQTGVGANQTRCPPRPKLSKSQKLWK